jgi:hypothetical protein
LKAAQSARVTLAGGTALLRTASLDLQGSAVLDLAGKDLILSNVASAASLRTYFRNALLNSGPRITNGTAFVAWVDNRKIRQSTWGGTAITDGTFDQYILVNTVRGDVNLDKQVTAADHAAIVANVGRSGADLTSFDGDLDFNGVVNADDFAVVTAALAGGGAGGSATPVLVTTAPLPTTPSIPTKLTRFPTPKPLPAVVVKKPLPVAAKKFSSAKIKPLAKAAAPAPARLSTASSPVADRLLGRRGEAL